MEELILPIPENLSAAYLVPLPAVTTAIAVRRQVTSAVATELTDGLKTLIREWMARGAISIEVTPTRPAALAKDPACGSLEQRERFARAPMFAYITATQPASLIAMHEVKARGAAVALAARLGVPLLDLETAEMLTVEEALASLPAITLTGESNDDVHFSFTMKPWVRFRSRIIRGELWVATKGMRRLGLPEISVGGTSRDLRTELTDFLRGLSFRLWSDLANRAQATPDAAELACLPRSLPVPAELDIDRKDIDHARGVPHRGGGCVTVGLLLGPQTSEGPWLIVCPPSYWDLGWADFIDNTCHAMFAFEKPAWHYLPEFGKLVGAMKEAKSSLAGARDRLRRGDLPPSSLRPR